MQLTLVRYDEADGYPETADTSVVTLKFLEPAQMCSLCSNRTAVWHVSPGEVTSTEDFGQTPLGAPDACRLCINELLETGMLQVMRVEPNGF